MAEYLFETNIDFQPERLVIQGYPMEAVVTYISNRQSRILRFVNPSPLSEVAKVFEGCCQIRIADLNADGRQWEYGRYAVELWDEDNGIGSFSVDAFQEHE